MEGMQIRVIKEKRKHKLWRLVKKLDDDGKYLYTLHLFKPRRPREKTQTKLRAERSHQAEAFERCRKKLFNL